MTKVVPLMLLERSSRKVFSIRCPMHPKIELGESDGLTYEHMHKGYWCGKCKRKVFFNEENFKKHLTSGLFPVIRTDE